MRAASAWNVGGADVGSVKLAQAGLHIEPACQGIVTHTRNTQEAASDTFLSSSFAGKGPGACMHLTSTPVSVCEAKCILYSQNWPKIKKQSVGWHTGDPGEPIMQFPSKGQKVGAQGAHIADEVQRSSVGAFLPA